MKNRILMYLFIFSVLFVIFIYVNDKRILDSKTEEISQLETRIERLEQETETANLNQAGEDYFNLENNEDAITYFDNKNIDYKLILTKIEEEFLNNNRADKDNALVPFDGMQGVMRINKIKVLNHKWIIADFTDGTYWGEAFYTYSVSKDGKLEINAEKSFIYPKY